MSQADTLEKLMGAPAGKSLTEKNAHPRVICVSSGKGGVGKSNITTNIAFNLSALGKNVLLLDADLNLANIDILLGLTPQFNIQHVLNCEKSLSEVIVNGPGGIKILPASSGVFELGELTEKQKIFFLAELETVGAELDFLLIDTAAGINSNVIYFALASQEKIIVLTPEPTSLTDAYALIKVLATQHGVKGFQILVNQSSSPVEALGIFKKLSTVADRFLDSISLDYMGHIPYDPKVPQAVKQQRLVAELYPESEASLTFKEITKGLAEAPPAAQLDGNINFFWKGMVNL